MENGIFTQVSLFIFSITAIVLVARKNKWGFVFGLLSQPFWFSTSWQHKQWGVFFVSIAYTLSWLYGIWNWFFNPKNHTP